MQEISELKHSLSANCARLEDQGATIQELEQQLQTARTHLEQMAVATATDAKPTDISGQSALQSAQRELEKAMVRADELQKENAITEGQKQEALQRLQDLEAQVARLGQDETDILICLAEVQSEKLAYKQKLRWFARKYDAAIEMSDDEMASDEDVVSH
eukprot:SAG31_NODE_2627_length_5351_cov_3.055979_3_plen_159_part_00